MMVTKAFANNIPVVSPSSQPAAVQNHSRRFCRGELTLEWRAVKPELISSENSAEALLAQIKVEQAALIGSKRGRKAAMSD